MTTTVRHESDVRQVRHLSKTLFGGAQYRLEVGAHIAASKDGIVNTAGLARELGVVAQSVNQELRLLESAGLITRLPRTGSERAVFFRREVSSYWAFCHEAYADAAVMLNRARAW